MNSNVPPAIADILDESEALLWHGKPKPGLLFGFSDWFTLATLSFVDIGAAFALRLGYSAFAWLAGIGTILGLLGILTPCILGLLRRRQTLYAVTNQRIAVISNSNLDRTVRSKYYDADFTVTAFPSPSHTTILYFGEVWRFQHWRYPPNHRFVDLIDPPAFVFLDDGPSVLETVVAAKREALAT